MSKPVATETSGLATSLAVSSTEQVSGWTNSPERAKAEANLWWWNAAMAALHGVQAIIVLGAALSVDRLKAFKIPMASKARGARARARGLARADLHARAQAAARVSVALSTLACVAKHAAPAPLTLARTHALSRARPPRAQITTFTDWSRGYPTAAIQHRADMPFVAVTSGFAFLSAFAHLVVLARFQVYKDDLRRGRNVFRWFEYAASSSLMIGESRECRVAAAQPRLWR